MPSYAQSGDIGFEQALLIALENDLTLASQREQLRAAEVGIESTEALPAPMLGLSLSNVPTDSFALDQEAMTQAKLSLSQKLPPRGLLAAKGLAQQQTVSIASAQSLLRRTQLQKSLGAAWIDGWKAVRMSAILDRHQSHFEQMSEAAEANFRAGLRRAKQRDILMQRTAVSRLENRRQAAITRLTIARESMREWLSPEQLERLDFETVPEMISQATASIEGELGQHPELQLAQAKEKKSAADASIAAAMGRPGRSLSLSYGYREAAANGVSRSDFISLGFSIELSALRASANRSRIDSAKAKRDQSMLVKQQIERRLSSDLISKAAIKNQIDKQLELFSQQIIPQSRQQAESVRSAYMSNEASFNEMQRAQIDLMNAELEQLDMQSQQLLLSNTLQYLSTRTARSQGGLQ